MTLLKNLSLKKAGKIVIIDDNNFGSHLKTIKLFKAEFKYRAI